MDKVIELFSDKLIDYFIYHGFIDEKKKSVYQYGMIVAIQSIINIVSTLIIGLVFGLFFENLCFFIVFRLIRKYSGGLHSEKYKVCLFISVILNVVFLILFRLFMMYPNFNFVIPIEIVSCLILMLLSPITNKNKNISKKEFKVFKWIVLVICIIILSCSAILILKGSFLVYSLEMAIVFDAFLVIIAKIKAL